MRQVAGRLRALTAALLLLVAPNAPAVTAEGQAGLTHEVQRGETLSHIALLTLGDPALWPAIYLANRDRIKEPSLIYPGQRLAIPEVDAAQREALRREVRAPGAR